MMASYSECIPLVNQLNHNEKLRLAQWLIKIIAQEEGVNDPAFDTKANKANQTGLCGIWRDSRSSDDILQEIVNNRTESRDFVL